MVSSSGETVWESSSSGKDKDNTLLMSCTGLDDTSGSGSIRATDCINGSLVQGSFLEGVSNYTQVMKVFNTLGRHPKADPRSNQQINFFTFAFFGFFEVKTRRLVWRANQCFNFLPIAEGIFFVSFIQGT